MKKYHTHIGIALATVMLSSQAAVKIDDSQSNSLVQRYSNEQTVFSKVDLNQTRGNHPTRVIRMDGKINESGLSCEEVQNKINETFFKQITTSHFMYNTLLVCNYDSETKYASRIVIDSYFDPLTDDDETLLQQLEQTYEGYPIYGVPMHIERAKGVVVSLELNASREDSKGDPRVIRFRRDFKSHHFNSNYDLAMQLIVDIRSRFYSQERDKIIPFLKQWFYEGIERSYITLLRQVNLMELMPERIFIMDKGAPIFTSHMHMYYTNHCQKYDSKVCLI